MGTIRPSVTQKPFVGVARVFCAALLMAIELVAIARGAAPPSAAAPAPGYDQARVGDVDPQRIVVPTNQVLTPLGRQVAYGGRPTDVALSPDGRWLAYVSDELGINEQSDVYVQAFPGGGKKVQVSADTLGGQQPRWGRDGRELFYVAPDKRIIAVPVAPAGDTLRLGPARPLFQTMIGSERGLGTRASYDVTRDGRRFIVAESRSRSADVARPFTLLVNWRSAVAKGVRPVDAPGDR